MRCRPQESNRPQIAFALQQASRSAHLDLTGMPKSTGTRSPRLHANFQLRTDRHCPHQRRRTTKEAHFDMKTHRGSKHAGELVACRRRRHPRPAQRTHQLSPPRGHGFSLRQTAGAAGPAQRPKMGALTRLKRPAAPAASIRCLMSQVARQNIQTSFRT